MLLAEMSKVCKNGSLSSWQFFKSEEGKFFAKSSSGKLIACYDVEDMRRFYKKMLAWGFAASESSVEA